jgi:hypothetical protein
MERSGSRPHRWGILFSLGLLAVSVSRGVQEIGAQCPGEGLVASFEGGLGTPSGAAATA